MVHRARRWVMRFDLSDDEWALLEPLMPKSRKSARTDDRKVLNAIFYVLRTGMPWRDLPERYGPYTTAYNRFNRWSRRGIWKRIFDTLASKSRDSLYLIDSTIVKAHRAASGAKGGRKIRRSASAAAVVPRKSTQVVSPDPSFNQRHRVSRFLADTIIRDHQLRFPRQSTYLSLSGDFEKVV